MLSNWLFVIPPAKLVIGRLELEDKDKNERKGKELMELNHIPCS
jgi:hypothetical protein